MKYKLMIREHRLLKGMSQAELAHKSRMDQSCISRLESEPMKKNPSIQTLIRIAAALGITLDELIKIFK